MTRFNKALLASASLVVLTSAAQAQVYDPATANQGISAVDWVDPINISNLAGAVGGGKGNATSEVIQIASIALNQFGANGSAVTVLGDYAVAQDFAYGIGESILVSNLNGAFTPGGFSRAGGSQIISTAINNISVDLSAGGQTFLALQTFGPDVVNGGDLTVFHVNSLTAGYDTNAPAVGTGGAEIVGIKPDSSTGTSGLQVASFGINSLSVNLPPVNASADVKIAQSVDSTNLGVVLTNSADAGAQSGLTPPPGGNVIDPLVMNLQQIAAFSANTATVTGETSPGGQIDLTLGAAFDTTTAPYTQVANQSFAGDGGVVLSNFASALTWVTGGYGGPNVPLGADWRAGGRGDVTIGGAFVDGKSGPVKQVAVFTVNTVSGATSAGAGLSTDGAKVFAGTIGTDLAGDVPLGMNAFQQSADLSNVDIVGRILPVNGAGIDISGLLALAAGGAAQGFPGYTAILGGAVDPTVFDWAAANNTAFAGTGQGNATVTKVDQIAAITANSFSFDNSVRDADGKVTFANNDIVGGAIDQQAILGNNIQLANVAAAVVTIKGTATLDTVNQTNAISVNTFTAGVADFNTGVQDPQDPSKFISGGLNQEINTNGALLNVGNAAVAYGTNAIAKDVKQINAVSLNTGTINQVSGGTISQQVTGGLNVNSGNYLSAVGSVTASITGAQQIGVVNVNSIVGAPVAP